MPTNSAIVPQPRDAEWIQRHEAFARRARSGEIDLLFVGDSLTDWWRDPERGGPVWDEHFACRKAANFGICADRTQHLLWRLRHGETEGFSPKAVVLLIGTNNTGMEKDGSALRNTPEEAIEGVLTVVEELRQRFSSARLVQFALFPRDERDSLCRRHVERINEVLAAAAQEDKRVFLDIGQEFLESDASIQSSLMPDLLHLSTEGYRIWARAIDAALYRIDGLSVPNRAFSGDPR